jgi:endoglucanase Acf2
MRFPGSHPENYMKNRVFAAFAFLFTVSLFAGCSGGSEDQSSSGTSQKAVQLLGPTPSLAGSVEVGNTIPLVPLRPVVTSAKSVSVISTSSRLLAQTPTATSSDSSLEPLSEKTPTEVLGTDRVVANPWQAKNLNDLKLVTLPDGERTRMPTGKWSKGFFYQSPRNIDAYFQFNGVPDDSRNQGGDTNEFSIFAYPNKLNLDDRIGMLSVSFPQRRYIEYGQDPNAAVYDLKNPLKTDTILYTIPPNSSQDLRLSYVQPVEGRLPRQIERFDELTVATSWSTPAGDKSMQIIAAEGSPYVTVRYTGLRAVVQVGQSSLARTAKDVNGLDKKPLTRDYTQQESDNAIQAVAVGEAPLTRFFERDTIRVTPVLTGTKFRFVYQLPDRAQTAPGTNDLKPVTPVLTLRELVLYASRPITLEWDMSSRSYISRDTLPVVVRTALVNDVLYDPDFDKPEKIADTPAFKARRAILDQYAATFPISSGLFVEYKQESGFVTYQWKMERMDGQPAQDSDLLMMAFDATHTPSLQNAKVVDGIAYRSNFGMMSGIAGSEWKQKLTIPSILRNGAPPSEFWMGTGVIKSKDDLARIKTSLEADTNFLTTVFLTTCNSDSYICGQYLHNVARLALIAHSLNEFETRDKLIAYLKKTMRLWLDGLDPNGVKVSKPAENKDNDMFLYDSTNGGTITSLGLQDPKKDYSNRTYVDHMFHYGYFIYAASVIAQLDTNQEDPWLAANQEKVNLLVRDIANPSRADAFFPIIRTFDWFRMQNIADAGPDANGGNTESSSESINSNYALVAWGIVTKNNQFQALAAIMAAAEIRTAQAFYQITPDTAYLKYIENPKGVSVTVQTPGGSESRTILPAAEPVINIVRSNLMETNTFFGSLLIYRIGINLLPITPISEFVIPPAWARVHAATLRKLEDTQTSQFNDIINAVPSENSLCFKAGWSPPGPHLDEETGKFIPPPPPGNACAGKLRVLYSWRQLAFAGVGITDPTSFQRYVDYMDALENQQKTYKQNTRSDIHPGSSEIPAGIDADVLKDNSTPSTNTNTLWWLASRKPG